MLQYFDPQPRYRPLILEIDTTKPGSASDTFVLPGRSGFSANAYIEWGDGSAEKVVTDAGITHVYPASGIYRVKIHGEGYGRQFPGLYFNDTGDKEKLIKVLSWGDIEYRYINLRGCNNLVDIPQGKFNINNATTFVDMFRLCVKLNSPILNIAHSPAVGTSTMFYDCSLFNSSVAGINTINCNSLSYMFGKCPEFNQSVATIRTDAATQLIGMFYLAAKFNQPVSHFNTAACTNMSFMFGSCAAFKQDLSSFNITSLTAATDMLRVCDINDPGTTTRYDALLNSWAGQAFLPNVPFHGGNAKYSAAAADARAALVAAGWTITDGGLA